MIKETYYTNGKDNFRNFVFDQDEWSAPYMVSYKEIKERIDGFELVGRKIRDVRVVGHSYWHTREEIEDTAYLTLEGKGLSEEEILSGCEYESIDDHMLYHRCMQIDEPLLIRFEDGDRLEIGTGDEPEYRVGMNTIPWEIFPGINKANADASIVFSPCIGKRIARIEYKTGIDSDFADTPIEYVNELIIWLTNGMGLLITIECHDYCGVYLINEKENIEEIEFGELKKALFNWEDLHVDEKTGFDMNCGTFFFGEVGQEHVDNPTVTICDEKAAHRLMMDSDDDFDLFAWAISIVTGKQYDQYEDYVFRWDQWNDILDEADRIVSFESFDDLYDYFLKVKDYGGCDLIYYVNSCAVGFWKKRELHKREADGMRKWCNLALGNTDRIFVNGY